jgi:hypothetical protein
MDKQFRDASFIQFKVALRDNKRTVREIKDIPADTTADKQKKIDMIMQIRQIQHDTIRMAKHEYPHIAWMKYV